MFSFLKSTAETENVVTGERSENGTRYPDGKNRMHTVEAFATHEWQVTPKVRMNDGVRLGYATTYSSVLDEEVFPFFAGKDQRKQNMTYSLAWGLNYLPAKTWKLAWSASTAYRVPNIDTASKVFEIKDPRKVLLPAPNLSTAYIFASGDNFFAIPIITTITSATTPIPSNMEAFRWKR